MFDPSDIRFIYMTVTVGVVVDTDDPQQEGRIRVRVPAYGDRPYALSKDLPWAMMASPFMGILQSPEVSRGAEDDNITDGQVSYGFWNVPKEGAAVLITCLNGDPMNRICLGCLPVQATNHTMPHGRYFYDTEELSAKGQPEGPLSSREKPIQPLYKNQSTAFGSRTNNYEYRTRGADHSLAAVDTDTLNTYRNDIDTKVIDDQGFKFTESDGNVIISMQGYRQTRTTNVRKLDSNVYSWVTPGFHAISMDDSVNNCRIRLRTSGGFQIILDDTNERLYINSAEGANWLELDQDGNIYMYGKRFSARVTEDMNFTADGTIRMYATKGIHMVSQGEIRLQSGQDIHLRTDTNLRIQVQESYFLEAINAVNIKGGTLFLTSGANMDILASGTILQTGSQIHLNGPSATQAAAPNAKPAFWTNMVPQHEPWARTTTADNFTHTPIYPYDSPEVGRQFKVRGPNWHR